MTDPARLRDLPSVHELVERIADAHPNVPRAVIVNETRRVLDSIRRDRTPTIDNVEPRIALALANLQQPSLRRVINATGVVLHTNLGRAPLPDFHSITGYSNLEYDLAAGRRGKRDVHVSGLIERLTGASGIAVNNNAAAIFLALNELSAGGETVVSRGELIEIGDGFRIPEIMARSGAALREVGATNRTIIDDYRAAITDRTRLLLRVHPSNFRITGFTARVDLRDLAALGRERGLPVYEDLGSGCLVDLRSFGIHEPLVSHSLEAGADLVSFSGDKLLGGPQAGILAGKSEIVARLRRNPLFRALRLDKLIYQSLESTLRNLLLERWTEVPAIAMIRRSAAEIRERALALLHGIPNLRAQLIEGESVIGGGSTPDQSIPTWLIAIESPNVVAAEQSLRKGKPPVIARIDNERLIVDLRTVLPDEENELANALRAL